MIKNKAYKTKFAITLGTSLITSKESKKRLNIEITSSKRMTKSPANVFALGTPFCRRNKIRDSSPARAGSTIVIKLCAQVIEKRSEKESVVFDTAFNCNVLRINTTK